MPSRPLLLQAALAGLLLLVPPAATLAADTAQVRSGPGATDLPIPRFVSLGTDEANLRAGPGVRYPIVWVLQRRGLPVMVTAEFDYWRKIRDADGAEGWVHKSLLSGRRFAQVTGDIRVLRAGPGPDTAGVARLEPGVIGRLAACSTGWCRLDVADFQGWLPTSAFYGAFDAESFED